MPRVIPWLAEQTAHTGYTRLEGDPQNENRIRSSSAQDLTWELEYGVIQYAIPILGWYRIALPGLRKCVTASGGQRADLWGCQESSNYQSGTQVLVAIDEDTDSAVIVSALPVIRQDSSEQFDIPSYLGSYSGLIRDHLASFYLSSDDAGGAWVAEDRPLSDTQPGDWYVKSSAGVYFSLDTFGLSAVVDDATGLWCDLISQTTEVAGRQMHITADGLRVQSDFSTANKFQLGGSFKLNQDPELEETVDPETGQFGQLEQTDSQFLFEFADKPYEVYVLNHYVVENGILTHLDGSRLISGRGKGTDFSETTFASMPQLRFLDYPPAGDQSEEFWYPRQETNRQELVDTVSSVQEEVDKHHFSQPLANFLELVPQWLEGEDQYVYLEELEFPPSPVPDVSGYESVQVGEEEDLDPSYTGHVLHKQPLSSWIHRQSDGSIFIGNESGAGIRIVGDTVFIEAANVRLTSAKDVNILARDVNVSAARDFNSTSEEFTRLVSNKNVAVLSGLSGTGGTLVESRGSAYQGAMPEDAQESEYSGISLKSRTHTTLYGNEVISEAVLDVWHRAGSSVISSAGNSITTHSGRVMNMFGGTFQSPGRISLNTGFSFVHPGNMLVNNGWFSGAVTARSNIQAVSGVVADVRGGPIGKVLPSAEQVLNDALSGFGELVEQSANSWLDKSTDLFEKFLTADSPLNSDYKSDLSVGFVNSSRSRKWFSSEKLQTTTLYPFSSRLPYTYRPRSPLIVNYRSSEKSQPTYPWPGNTQEIQLSTPVGVSPLVDRFRDTFSGEVRIDAQEIPFSSVFQVIDNER